jgi:hypothetical protein
MGASEVESIGNICSPEQTIHEFWLTKKGQITGRIYISATYTPPWTKKTLPYNNIITTNYNLYTN